MWNVNGINLMMTEGDFGVRLPVYINGVTLGQNDSVKIAIISSTGPVVERVFDNISGNKAYLVLSEQETAMLPVGDYKYRLDWYQNGSFMCNIIPSASFRVVDKA